MREESADNLNPGQRSKSPVPNRWVKWAQTINAGRMRAGLRFGGLSVIFAHPQTPLVTHLEQWRQTVLTLSPNINLAIQRTLQQIGLYTIRHESASWMPGRTRTVFLSPASSVEKVEPSQRNDGDAANGWNLGRGEARALLPNRWSNRPDADAMQSPLERVLARTIQTEAGAAMAPTGLLQEVLFVQHSLQFTERVVDERRRIEEQRQRIFVVREERQPLKPQANSIQAETTFQSPFVSRAGAAGMSQFQTPAALDVERLTDQIVQNIDRRITAHRERLGKVF